MISPYFDYSPEVSQAIEQQKPLLALESTLLTHGLAFPQNLKIAQTIECIAKDHGVTPATIAIMHGKIKIGLSANELLALVNDHTVLKASRRDIPFIVSQGLSAGTTVAATLFCAACAGIKVFATGGIGGVHRGDLFDVSADLLELAKTPIAVVCAGAKAILDVQKTLEFLEMLSVPIVGYQTDSFPAFYTANSPYPLSYRINNIENLVKFLTTHWQLGASSGVLIANPIPMQDEIPSATIEIAITHALKQAEKKHITGKEITPFLLKEVAQQTLDQSIKANLSLIENNVKIGSMLARALSHKEAFYVSS